MIRREGEYPQVSATLYQTVVRFVLLFGAETCFFFGGDVPKAGGSATGIPQTDDGTEVKAAEGCDLEKRGIDKGDQGSGNPDTGE